MSWTMVEISRWRIIFNPPLPWQGSWVSLGCWRNGYSLSSFACTFSLWVFCVRPLPERKIWWPGSWRMIPKEHYSSSWLERPFVFTWLKNNSPLQSTSSASANDHKCWLESINLYSCQQLASLWPTVVTYSLGNHMLRTLAMNHFNRNPHLE